MKHFKRILFVITLIILKKYLNIYGYYKRGIIYNKFAENQLKVNLGAGLKIAPGWINVDFNLPTLFARWPAFILKLVYNFMRYFDSTYFSRPYRFSIDINSFIYILKNNVFICHNLLNGLPFIDNSVDYYYSSHMIGFSFPKKESKYVLEEMYRTLRKKGKIRLSIVDGDVYWKNRTDSNIFLPNDNCFNFEELKTILHNIGFSTVIRKVYKEGTIPDLELLDDYSPELDKYENSRTLYLEAEK